MSYAKVWSCALPGCTHFMPKHQEAAVNGRLSRCWGCDTEFVLDNAAMTEDNPRCEDCRAGNKHSSEDILSALEQMNLAEKD